jgi:hypothetical protein
MRNAEWRTNSGRVWVSRGADSTPWFRPSIVGGTAPAIETTAFNGLAATMEVAGVLVSGVAGLQQHEGSPAGA